MADIEYINKTAKWWHMHKDSPVDLDSGIALADQWLLLCEKYDAENVDRGPIYVAIGAVLAALVGGMEKPDPDTAVKLASFWMKKYLETPR